MFPFYLLNNVDCTNCSCYSQITNICPLTISRTLIFHHVLHGCVPVLLCFQYSVGCVWNSCITVCFSQSPETAAQWKENESQLQEKEFPLKSMGKDKNCLVLEIKTAIGLDGLQHLPSVFSYTDWFSDENQQKGGPCIRIRETLKPEGSYIGEAL